MATSHSILVRDERGLNAAVIEATRVAQAAGLSRVATQQVATVTSELARNILKYAGHGRVHLNVLERNGQIGVRVVATDQGPGIEDVEQALTDHYSTGGTLGLGLSGVKRMMDELTISSDPGKGTRVEATKWV
jgi:serine/threonine-protein kinase RsbT